MPFRIHTVKIWASTCIFLLKFKATKDYCYVKFHEEVSDLLKLSSFQIGEKLPHITITHAFL